MKSLYVPSTGVLLFLVRGQFNIYGSCCETFWAQDGEGTRQMLCPILADLPPRGIVRVVGWVVVNQVPSGRFVVNEVNSTSHFTSRRFPGTVARMPPIAGTIRTVLCRSVVLVFGSASCVPALEAL